jgi:hypothetical protein
MIDQHQCAERKLPLIIMTKFCTEGNNITDSADLARVFARYSGITDPADKLYAPPSWKHIKGSPILRDTVLY